jgi:hypothetical protein
MEPLWLWLCGVMVVGVSGLSLKKSVMFPLCALQTCVYVCALQTLSYVLSLHPLSACADALWLRFGFRTPPGFVTSRRCLVIST